MIGPRGTLPLTNDMPHVDFPFDQLSATSPIRTIRTVQSASIYFFACLTLWTDCNISRSWCPFETKWVALGSKRRGLRSLLVCSDSEHFEFLSKIWSPDHWVMKRDQVVFIQATKTSSSLSNLQPMTTTNLQKQMKIINHLGGVKKKVPELNL